MPKLKSRSSAKKRFFVTANGELKHKQQGRNHILSKKTPKRKRDLRANQYVESKTADTIRIIIQK